MLDFSVFPIGLAITSLCLFAFALRKARSGAFYQDTHLLIPLGIYVWGDALVLSIFWLVSAGLFIFFSQIDIVRYLLLFYCVRSFYEVLYWITHQVAAKDYRPPLLREVKWIGPNEAAILYQLIHTCVIIFGIVCLVYTFRLPS